MPNGSLRSRRPSHLISTWLQLQPQPSSLPLSVSLPLCSLLCFFFFFLLSSLPPSLSLCIDSVSFSSSRTSFLQPRFCVVSPPHPGFPASPGFFSALFLHTVYCLSWFPLRLSIPPTDSPRSICGVWPSSRPPTSP